MNHTSLPGMSPEIFAKLYNDLDFDASLQELILESLSARSNVINQLTTDRSINKSSEPNQSSLSITSSGQISDLEFDDTSENNADQYLSSSISEALPLLTQLANKALIITKNHIKEMIVHKNNKGFIIAINTNDAIKSNLLYAARKNQDIAWDLLQSEIFDKNDHYIGELIETYVEQQQKMIKLSTLIYNEHLQQLNGFQHFFSKDVGHGNLKLFAKLSLNDFLRILDSPLLSRYLNQNDLEEIAIYFKNHMKIDFKHLAKNIDHLSTFQKDIVIDNKQRSIYHFQEATLTKLAQLFDKLGDKSAKNYLHKNTGQKNEIKPDEMLSEKAVRIITDLQINPLNRQHNLIELRRIFLQANIKLMKIDVNEKRIDADKAHMSIVNFLNNNPDLNREFNKTITNIESNDSNNIINDDAGPAHQVNQDSLNAQTSLSVVEKQLVEVPLQVNLSILNDHLEIQKTGHDIMTIENIDREFQSQSSFEGKEIFFIDEKKFGFPIIKMQKPDTLEYQYFIIDIESMLGTGSFGAVYLTQNPHNKTWDAIKIIDIPKNYDMKSIKYEIALLKKIRSSAR